MAIPYGSYQQKTIEIVINSFFFGKRLLSPYYILYTILSTEDSAVNKTDYYKADWNIERSSKGGDGEFWMGHIESCAFVIKPKGNEKAFYHVKKGSCGISCIFLKYHNGWSAMNINGLESSKVEIDNIGDCK